MISRTLAAIGIAVATVFPFTATHAAEITAESVKAALPRLDAIVNDAMEQTEVPGVAVAVVVGDEVVYLKGFGVRKVGEETPVDPDTVFQIASVSKPLTSSAIASVVGTGEVAWDSRIADLDPGFRLIQPWVSSQVTIRDLLSHRSGMPDHAGDLLEDLGYDRDEILYRLRFLEPSSSFRSQYAYTNFLFTEAGVAAARTLSTSWEDLVDARVFEPLGMTSSSARHADYLAAENRASIHAIENGDARARYDRNPDAQAPAGGVSSSARDMAKWLTLLINKGSFEGRQIIDGEALGETFRPQITSGTSHEDGRAEFYGLGWIVNYDTNGLIRLSHSGAFFTGARSVVSFLPGEEVGIIVLANAFPTGLPEAVTNTFFDILLRGEPQRDWLPLFEGLFQQMLDAEAGYDFSTPPDTVSPGLSASAYAGQYANAYFGDLQIAEDGDGLAIRLGNGLGPFPLTHWDRDVFNFTFLTHGDDGERTVGVTFTVPDGKQARAVTLDFLNAFGTGTFARVEDGKE